MRRRLSFLGLLTAGFALTLFIFHEPEFQPSASKNEPTPSFVAAHDALQSDTTQAQRAPSSSKNEGESGINSIEIPFKGTPFDASSAFRFGTSIAETRAGPDDVTQQTPQRSKTDAVAFLGGRTRIRESQPVTQSGLNGRVTQSEVDSLKNGLSQTLVAIEGNLVSQVFAETLPLVGTNFVLAWSNNVAGFRYVNKLRTNIVNGLSTLTNQPDYAPESLQTAINSRLTSAGFNAGSGVVVTTPNDLVQLVFTSSDTFSAASIPLATNFGIPNAQLFTLNQTNCSSALGVIFNFSSGVDGSGFYLDTTGATMQFNMTNTIGNLTSAVRFARLPFTFTDNTTNRTSVPLNFVVTLKDPNTDRQLRLSELSGSPDLLDAKVSGNTKLSFKLLSSLPSSAMLPVKSNSVKSSNNFFLCLDRWELRSADASV